MPARTSTRTSATSSRKASVTPATNTKINIPDEGESTSLRVQICSIFADSQRNIAGHRKLVVRLRRVQEACCYEPQSPKKKSAKRPDEAVDEEFDEDEFNAEVCRCLLRILPVKKTEGAGDRVVRFLGLFLRSAMEKDVEIFAQGQDPDETMSFPETPSSRLVAKIVSVLVTFVNAKDRVVRFRATQILSHIVNSLDSIDDDIYQNLTTSLRDRIYDKELTIRIQAVSGLVRLTGGEIEEDDEDEENPLVDLLTILQHDSSSEVRRSLLANLPLTPSSLKHALERARDTDAQTRRTLYAKLLPQLGDFRHLSLSMREKLLRWGLRDRDENVRKATAKLFRERWIEDCAGDHVEQVEGAEPLPAGQAHPPTIPALLELLERIDVVNSGTENGIALTAMKEFWEGRPDYREAVTFDDAFWNDLTSESVFMARSFNEFCRQDSKYENLLEDKMPEVTRLAYYLAKYTHSLIESIKTFNEDGEGDEQETVEKEFVVEQLLHMALNLDYSDEVGRRKMFSLLRESLALPELPEEVTKLTVEVLRCTCSNDAAGEREFCGVVLEAVAEVHDTIVEDATEEDDDAQSFVSAQSEIEDDAPPTGKSKKSKSAEAKKGKAEDTSELQEAEEKMLKEITINMKCLHIARCMLQNVQGNLQENSHLVTMLNNLVVPAVRSHEAPIRERGLECLGLCCLLDKTLSEENLTLFIHCFNKGHENLQITCLQILSDILTTHPSILVQAATDESGLEDSLQAPSFQKPLLKAFLRALKPTSPAPVQAVAATSLSKLLLTTTMPSTSTEVADLLKALVLAFFDPRTSDNAALRQSLAYFLPMYCHSRKDNLARMRSTVIAIIHGLYSVGNEVYVEDLEEDSDGNVDEKLGKKRLQQFMTTVVGVVADWTDARKLVQIGNNSSVLIEPPKLDESVMKEHLLLLKDILGRVLGVQGAGNLDRGCNKEEKKYLFALSVKLFIGTGEKEREREESTTPSAKVTPQVIADEDSELELFTSIKALLDEAITDDIAPDTASRNALVKHKNAILKMLKTIQQAKEQRERGGTKKSRTSGGTSTSGRSRRSESVMTVDTNAEEEDDAEEVSDADTVVGDSEGRVKANPKSKKAKTVQVTEPVIKEEQEDEDEQSQVEPSIDGDGDLEMEDAVSEMEEDEDEI